MFRIVVLIALSALFAFGGTISGELIYPGGGMGAYGVIVLDPATIASVAAGDSVDFTSLPMAMLFMPGAYSITDSFEDGIPYTVFGVKIEDMSSMQPVSGDPMGLYPENVFTFSGNASGIDVELDTVGAIGGHITYSGNISDVKMNVYDMMSGSTPVLEGVYPVGSSADYSVIVSSGFKTLEFFADLNDNDVWDTDAFEPGVYYTGIGMDTWGPIVFAGGGDRFATGVDPVLPPSAVKESGTLLPKFTLSCTPNPFNSSCEIAVNGVLAIRELPIQVEIYNLQGNIVGSRLASTDIAPYTETGDASIASTRTFTWHPDKTISSGIYFVRARIENGNFITKRVVYLK